MKKEYSKPLAIIQNMTVNSFVAGACMDAGAAVIDFGEEDCYYESANGWVFFSYQCESEEFGMYGLNIVHPNDESPFAQLCYHRPLDALSFFNS